MRRQRQMRGVILCFICFVFVAPSAFSEPDGKILYNYDRDDLPVVCFFPIQVARWHGYQVTVADWQQFDDYLKMSFMVEGVDEIAEQNNSTIRSFDGVSMVNTLDEEVRLHMQDGDRSYPMIRILYELLQKNRLVVSRSGGGAMRQEGDRK